MTGLSWVSGLAQGAAAKESPFVAVVLGWLRLHLRYAASDGALDAVGGPYRRVKPFPSFPYPQPTTRILSHPSGVWLTFRSLPRRGVRKTGDCRTSNDARKPPVFGHAEARFSTSAFGGKADVNHCVGECPLLARSRPKDECGTRSYSGENMLTSATTVVRAVI